MSTQRKNKCQEAGSILIFPPYVPTKYFYHSKPYCRSFAPFCTDFLGTDGSTYEWISTDCGSAFHLLFLPVCDWSINRNIPSASMDTSRSRYFKLPLCIRSNNICSRKLLSVPVTPISYSWNTSDYFRDILRILLKLWITILRGVLGVEKIHSMSPIMMKSGESPFMKMLHFLNSSRLKEPKQDFRGLPFYVNANIIENISTTGT